ncbi:cytochrome B6 [Helicobacter monodelphidis]|uniref:cytochrome-c peroxidase n=1 Tax=Helicobacter sp. 15-1451 TaxID=2004995 RepID=UPI000DCE376E|nr:cytochrome-c peroxidase [Helicobacter sp. 15-1451]RAX57242.1 cytochrome B6 [Helicobacter sp. 15-1451]
MRIMIIVCVFLIPIFAVEMIIPIPDSIHYEKEKALLGKKLYLDARLSKDGKVACATCHNLATYGVDNKAISLGVNGIVDDPFNTPTSFNAVFNLSQFWDGRANSLKEQAKGPITNPKEMAFSEEEAIAVVQSDEAYMEEFEKLYKGEVSLETIADAIAEFEKTLLTPNSPFDRYLKGDQNAISESAKRGYESFKANGCISCHHGIGIGGNMYQKVGIFTPYNTPQLGRYDVTKKEEDKYFFKVPSLRNIDKTAPYFHDGSVINLETTIQLMALYQLGTILETDEINDLVAFLQSLTGEYKDALHQ